MKLGLILTGIAVLIFAAFVGVGIWKFQGLFPRGSTEVVVLTPAKRDTLARLRAEVKFKPNDYPPLGYTGMATPEDEAKANLAVNGVIDAILARSDNGLSARFVSDLIGKGMRSVDQLETEDRDRTQGYMLEIWYLAGFKGATGRFAYGSSFKPPSGYGEPLPPGWISPDHPRPIP